MDYEKLSRKDLQALAKQHGIKANLSTAAIIEALNALSKPEAETQEHTNTDNTVESKEKEEKACRSILQEPEICLENFAKSIPIAEAPTNGPFQAKKHESTSTDFEVGMAVEFFVNGVLLRGTIKKVNKVTCRVAAIDGEEMLVKSHELTVVNSEDQVLKEESFMGMDSVEESISTEEAAPQIEEVASTEAEEVDLMEEKTETKSDEEIMQEVDRVLDESMIDFDEMDEEVDPELDEENDENPIDEEDEEVANYQNDDEYEEVEMGEEVDRNEDDEDSYLLPSMDSLIGGETPRRSSTGEHRRSRMSSILKSPFSPVVVSARKSLSERKSLPKENLVVKKTFSTTPLKPKPTIVPRTNAALQKRLEALQQKKKQEQSIIAQNVPTTTTVTTAPKKEVVIKKKTPNPIATTSILKPVTEIQPPVSSRASAVKFDIAMEEKNSSVKMNAKLAARKATPNFKAMHRKQFENSKSIASIVERDHSIVKKMDAAFKDAQTAPFSSINHPKPHSKPITPHATAASATAHHSSNVKVTKPLAFRKPANIETKVNSFLPTAAEKDKENCGNGNSFLAGSQMHLAKPSRPFVKDASMSKTMGVDKKAARRQSFGKQGEASRKNLITQKRLEQPPLTF